MNLRKAAKTAGVVKELADRDLRNVVPKDVAGVKVLGDGPTPCGGQNSQKLDEALNFIGPKIEERRVPINGNTIAVGTNAADQARAVKAPDAPTQVPPGAAGAPGVPGKVASVEAPEIKEAGKMMVIALERLDGILRGMDRGGSSPRDHLGDRPVRPYWT